MSISNCHCGDCRGFGACCVKKRTGSGFGGASFFKIAENITGNTSNQEQWFLESNEALSETITVGGLPPELFENMSTSAFTQVRIGTKSDAGVFGIRIFLPSNDDIRQFQQNLNTYLSGKTFSVIVRVNELYTDSVRPSVAFYDLSDSDGNNINTETQVGDYIEYHWSVDDIVATVFNNSFITLEADPNSIGVPLIARSHPYTARGCNNSNSDCRNEQVCTWGKNPSFAFLIQDLAGTAGGDDDEFINRAEGCTINDILCDQAGILQRCCDSSAAISFCEDNNYFINLDGTASDCCCVAYLESLGSSASACCEQPPSELCPACACCQGVGENGPGDCTETCDDPTYCYIGAGNPDDCGIGNNPPCNCVCHGQPCSNPGVGNCSNAGVWDFPGCGGCSPEGTPSYPPSTDYYCLETSFEYCNLIQDNIDVEWTCFNGSPSCSTLAGGPLESGICPCLDTVEMPIENDICGCARDNTGALVSECNSVAKACLTQWDDSSDCTSTTKFALNFTTKDGTPSSNLVLETKATYYNQIKPEKCGCDTSCPDASVPNSIGHLDPCFDFTGISCCPNWCDGVCPVYNNITFKKINHCNFFTNLVSCTQCSGSNVPTMIEGAPLKVTLDFNIVDGIELQRNDGWNDYVAVSPNGQALITTTNSDYTVPTDTPNGFDTWENILGGNGPLFNGTSGYLLQTLLFKDDTEKDLVLNDFSDLSCTWKMETYCWNELRSAPWQDWPWGSGQNPINLDAKNIYSLLSGFTWAHQGASKLPDTNQVWLRLYTTDLRSLYRTANLGYDCNGNPKSTQGNDPEWLYNIDHVYASDSQYERGYTDFDCLTKEGPDCNDGGTCKYGNPWEAMQAVVENQDDSKRMESYIDANGAERVAAEGDFQFPIKPHKTRFELWFVAEAASPCVNQIGEDAGIDYSPEFKLAGIIREVADCSSCEISQYNTGDENQYRLYNDTCGSFYWQCKPRSTKVVAYPLVDDGSEAPWNQDLTLIYTDDDGDRVNIEPGIESDSAPRVISLTPKDGALFRSGTGDTTQDSVTALVPAAAVAWDEDMWYHADPKHSFDAVGKGIPQATGRWTELPFKNYAREYLDESSTLPGFYLTLSAYHMDGISNVSYYLDGAKSGNGVAAVSDTVEHPLEPAKAQMVRDDDGNLLTSLKEYTVAVDTSAITTGVHEVRAKINPKKNQYGGRGTSRFLYGEPPTGDASVNTADLTNVIKGTDSYSVIDGEDWPFSQAQWPVAVPDGPPIYINNNLDFANQMLGISRERNNLTPMWGAENFWNLHNAGFNYYANGTDATNKTRTKYTANNYIFSGTPQQELLLNGYESFWFNYNPAPLTVYVGQSGDTVPDGSQLFESLSEAFSWLESNYTADNAALHDAEIVLIAGTKASPRKYNWINSYIGESLPSSTGWCQNALEKKSFVIRSENPDDKEGTILWFPPSQDRVVMPWNNFALHVRDLTVYTSSQRGEVDKSCLQSSGTNCRLLVENVIFASTCTTGIKASELVDSGGDVICGDSLQRSSGGVVTGQIDYSKCQNINTTTNNIECAKDTSDCASVTCCGAKVTGGCEGCTGASCTRCRKNCLCRSSEIEWWPFFCSDDLDMASSGTSLEPVILCGNNDCTGPSWNCKGVFGSDIVTSSSFMCLGTQPEHCVILGLFNHDLMDMANASNWNLGMYGKDIEVRDVPGCSLKNPVLMKHLLVDNYNQNLISDKGHGCILDLWVKNADPLTGSTVPDMDIVEWETIGYDTYSLEAAKDYDQTFASSNPRSIRNFNCFIENRMMVNVKVDNCHARVINIKGPGLRYRDFLADPYASVSTHSGHHNNFGMPSTRNFVFKDFHIEDIKASDQVFGNFPINHLYIDNFVISNHLSRNCASTASTSDTCDYSGDGALFPLSNMALDNDAYLHYGKKPIQNLSLKNSLFQNLGTGEYAWDKDGTSIVDASSATAKFQNIIDWGRATRKAGNGYSINLPEVAGTVRYFWNNTFPPVIRNVRQQRTARDNSTLFPSGSSTGPVVHKSISPPLGHTACTSGCDYPLINHNPYSIDSTTTDWLANGGVSTAKQFKTFGVDATTKRITSNGPKFSATLITGRSRKTADGTALPVSPATDPFQYPSEAHSNLIGYAEGLTSGNIFDRGIPNVGGILLTWASPKGYYHDVCTFDSIAQTCKRNAILDGRYTNENLTVITEDGGVYSWSTNSLAECMGNCKVVRDHYFIDNTDINNKVDLDWIPVIDECRCSDV